MNKKYLAIGLAATVLATAARADDPISIHGFGNQDYWKSGSTGFNGSGPNGTFDNNDLGLVLRGTVNDRVHVYAQIQASSVDPVQMLWMFADVQVNDDLRFKVGKVKFPQGIMNETLDARGLQVSALTPMMYYDVADFVHDAYIGAGLDYDYSLGKNGKLTLQPFLGNTTATPAPLSSPPFTPPSAIADTTDRRLFGAKVTWETPLDGLRLMASGYNITVQTTNLNGQTPGVTGGELRYVLSVDYTTEKWDVKSEYAHHHFPALSTGAEQTSYAWYLQGGYHMGDWMPYARYDTYIADTSHSGDPSYYQHDFMLGIDRLLLPNLHARVEDHFNRGYAMPVANGDVAAGTGQRSWNLFAVQINYMF